MLPPAVPHDLPPFAVTGSGHFHSGQPGKLLLKVGLAVQETYRAVPPAEGFLVEQPVGWPLPDLSKRVLDLLTQVRPELEPWLVQGLPRVGTYYSEWRPGLPWPQRVEAAQKLRHLQACRAC